MRKWLSIGLLVCLLVGSTSNVLGWNKAGHMVAGAIAYYSLKEKDPTALARIIEILEEHPDFEDWEDSLDHVDPQDREVVIFMLASRWPDDVRGTADDRPAHHFINRPYLPGGELPSIQIPAPAEEDIMLAFRANRDILRSANQSDDEKAKAICWLLHLVQDAHQPLHTVARFDADFTKGDRGGTRFYVKAKPNSDAMSLHQFWDGMVIRSERFRTVRNRGIALRSKYPRSSFTELVGTFADTDFQKWIDDESVPLAKSAAHLNGALKGGKKRSNAQTLPQDYSAASKPVAEKRMTMAGYRLADIFSATIE